MTRDAARVPAAEPRTGPAIAGLLVLAFGGLTGCMNLTPSRHSNLQQKTGRTSVSASELRQRVYEVPGQLGGIIEAAADEIRASSPDPAARRRALLWKADGIPALYTAALRPDPLAGALDLWLAVEQMRRYFTEGNGKDAFGAQQPVATAAMARVVTVTEATALSLAADRESFEGRRADIERFAIAHPIETSFAARESALLVLARLGESENESAFAAVGEATDNLADITLRLNAYVALLPKVSRWQAELAIEDVTGRDSLRSTLDNLDTFGEVARRANLLLADIPGAARQASGPLAELIDQQRIELLAAIDRERIYMTSFATAERQAAMAAISAERQAAMESLTAERVAAMAAIEALTERTLASATLQARQMGQFVFVRTLILLVVAVLLLAIGYRLARGRPR